MFKQSVPNGICQQETHLKLRFSKRSISDGLQKDIITDVFYAVHSFNMARIEDDIKEDHLAIAIPYLSFDALGISAFGNYLTLVGSEKAIHSFKEGRNVARMLRNGDFDSVREVEPLSSGLKFKAFVRSQKKNLTEAAIDRTQRRILRKVESPEKQKVHLKNLDIARKSANGHEFPFVTYKNQIPLLLNVVDGEQMSKTLHVSTFGLSSKDNPGFICV